MISWDQYFLDIANAAARRSKDTNTQLGCVIHGSDYEIISTGYNGFPRGLNDHVPERFERPEKYFWFEHAERNAIYNVARRILKGSTIVVPWIPCTDCARAVVQSGISTVKVESLKVPERWKPVMERSMIMFQECGVEICLLT